MSRYRLLPARGQELALRRHCSDARWVWNQAVEKRKSYLASDRQVPAPTKSERYKQLTLKYYISAVAAWDTFLPKL